MELRVTGPGARATFRHESGGHRWQRVPPTERKGRVQSSTVTVATFPEIPEQDSSIQKGDVEERTYRGGGPGGQHRNKTESGVELTHRPTGIQARSANLKCQFSNRRAAWAVLRARVSQHLAGAKASAENASRRAQVGTSERSDKRRTVRCQDGIVTDHVLERKLDLDRYLRGEWDKLLA